MLSEGTKRVVIERVTPCVDDGRFPVKRVIGEQVAVEAAVFADGHDRVVALLRYREKGTETWAEKRMSFLGNDVWRATFDIEKPGGYEYTVTGWVDHFLTWQRDLRVKNDAGQEVGVDLLVGAGQVAEAAERATKTNALRLRELSDALKGSDLQLAVSIALGEDCSRLMEKYADRSNEVHYEKVLSVAVERRKALFSSWYEMFPRSCDTDGQGSATFSDCRKHLAEIAEMGFDVLYFPPIHPIGESKRKGRDNVPAARKSDPGSPWAIGSKHGGHKAIDPALGTIDDFGEFVEEAGRLGIEVALDLAFQCSPNHPYVKEHPEWFRTRPDGTIQYAENPPKKYEDIVPFYFETEAWQELWKELKSVVEYWIDHGIRIFRVDNPHTKAFAFWEWLIAEIKRKNPDILFLSEAFTRPRVMYRLAKIGFSQSYTYFTWRNTKPELQNYLAELTRSEVREFFRPNFWPNTPDILPEYLQYGGRPAFVIRLVLAATLSSNYGIYGPPFELWQSEALTGKEEYRGSEKYEVKRWKRDAPGNLRELITRVNRARRDNPALQSMESLRFCETDNDHLLFFVKRTADGSNAVLVVVNLDPHHTQSGWIQVPIDEFDIPESQSYMVHDLISEDRFIWQGSRNYVELDPHSLPAHIFELRRRLRREVDFDYYM